MFKKVAFVAVAGLTLASQGASAAQLQSNMAVTAAITGTCTLSANPMAFPNNITTTSSVITANTTLDVNCTTGIPYTIGINYGANVNGVQRRMNDGGPNFLSYDLCLDAACTTIYDNIGGNPARLYSSNGSGAESIPVYGQLPIQTTPPTGNYADTAVVTINY
jgi:spore coat protein U-like protein